MGLTIIGAVLFITGLLMVAVGEALRLKSGHSGPGIASTGEFVALSGLGIGVALLMVLAVGRPERRPADRVQSGRAPMDRARGDGSGRGRPLWAVGAGRRSGLRRDAAGEWLGPLRTGGAGIAAQRVPPYSPETAESRPGSDDYSDDGWHPDMDEEWSPGPAYVWNSGREDGWDSGGDGAWDRGGDQDWNVGGHEGWDLGEPAGVTAWPQAHLAGPVPGYGSDRDAEYAADREAGNPAAGPVPRPVAAPHFAANPETDYPRAPGTDVPETDRTREADDTSPIPVIRDAGQPAAQPRPLEPVSAPEPFSVWEPAPKRGPAPVPEPFPVWEPAPKPEPAPVPEPFPVWEPAPKPGQQRDRDGRSDDAYQPAHAESPAAHTQEKIEQIKDLYLTAEAIGEDALGRHFDELRQRQRSLISEFFEKAGLGTKDRSTLRGDDPAQDGASLPG